jgi:co-chaperonin GroES (HSP10)
MSDQKLTLADQTVREAAKRQQLQKKDKLYVRSENNRVIVGERVALSIRVKDNIVVLEDEFKSEYDCKECDGVGQVVTNCTKCEGTGQYLDPTDINSICGKCNGVGTRISECKACNGKGLSIVIPDQAKTRPTSGKIVAVGPETIFYKIGERVTYTGYTGHLIPFKGNTRLRIMREVEAFCLVEDYGDPNSAVGMVIEFVDKDSPYDVS